jgi:hypothetical protein
MILTRTKNKGNRMTTTPENADKTIKTPEEKTAKITKAIQRQQLKLQIIDLQQLIAAVRAKLKQK